MSTLIVQADDYAMTPAVTVGIVEGVRNGLIRATGVFTNRPDAARAIDLLAGDSAVDLGIDINFVTGVPLLPPEEVPSLVTPQGRFRTSHEIKAQFREIARDGFYQSFDPEPFDEQQTLREARAQAARFFELTGRSPAYFHHHSLISDVSDAVVRQVAQEYDSVLIDDLFRAETLPLLPNPWYDTPFTAEEQRAADPTAAIDDLVARIVRDEVSVLITHPGYVDAELLDITSYHVVRARDLELVTSPRFAAALRSAGVTVGSFRSAGILSALQ